MAANNGSSSVDWTAISSRPSCLCKFGRPSLAEFAINGSVWNDASDSSEEENLDATPPGTSITSAISHSLGTQTSLRPGNDEVELESLETSPPDNSNGTAADNESTSVELTATSSRPSFLTRFRRTSLAGLAINGYVGDDASDSSEDEMLPADNSNVIAAENGRRRSQLPGTSLRSSFLTRFERTSLFAVVGLFRDDTSDSSDEEN